MANGHGGARPGSGRKPNTEKYADAVESFTDSAAADLPDRYEVIQRLADGGWEQVAETYEPAGIIYVDAPLLKDGAPAIDANGRPILVKQLAFPHLAPEQLVLVRRTVRVAAPDRAANEYLVDRVAGKPRQQVAAELTGPNGEAIVLQFQQAAAKIYGDDGADGEH